MEVTPGCRLTFYGVPYATAHEPAPFLIAAPIAYHFMQQRLKDFHYPIQMGVGILLLAIIF